MMRCEEPGWHEVFCIDGRRGLWRRETRDPETNLLTTVELCAGREGDDDYVKVEGDHATLVALAGLISTSRWAIESGLERCKCGLEVNFQGKERE